jgi:hypothetical protein
MKKYNLINNLTGWFAFAVAAVTYFLTIEETGSFWDCGEFIAAAFKLQVGHPPGASLFLLIGRIFTMFAFGDLTKVAIMVNMMSALASAITILFLFWSITHIARKLVKVTVDELTNAHYLMIMGSGLIGALAYTFSDSFWFSAVEGEVYAMSSMFTAIVFWAMLKWENHADEKHSDKWLVLIAYLMGLSIGVHLLNLLAIPALAYIYYFRRYKPTTNGILLTALIGVAILGFIQYGVIQGFVKIGAHLDLIFVNTFKLPFWSGFLFFVLLLVVGTYLGIRYSIKANKPQLNTAFLCFAFILLGYASYGQVVIRSMANPPMDENNPENAFALLSYLNREQYGDRPLLYGQYYTAKMIDQDKGSATYAELDGKYVKTGNKIEPVYDKEASTLFPRMHSNQDNHVQAYKEWMDIRSDRNPTMGENLGFFFSYQLGHMFWRYFLWNFAGRQNDLQGHGSPVKGNWMSGIKGLDEARVGNLDKYPDSLANNKAYNKFYLLPLILGLIGMFYHFNKDKFDGSVVMLLFFFTGIAIVIYLNQTPYQPRERDYAYAGSFYAFAIWIGLGVMALANYASRYTKPMVAGVLALSISFASAPWIMAKEGWDDHDRSHRFTSRDFAHNYLNSCAPNAIIFTNGDNDTFPLWYAQEVEGIRTDVRVINLSLLNTDWYIEQMHLKQYESEPIPFSLQYKDVIQGTRDYLPIADLGLEGYRDLRQVIDFIKNDEAKRTFQNGESMNFFPTSKFFIPVDSAKVVSNGTVPKEMASRIVNRLEFDVDRNYLMKADIMILDLLAHNNWERPVYFAITVGSESYLNLEDYFQLEGMAYRLVPVKNEKNNDGQLGSVNTSEMYNKMVNTFKWGNMSDSRVYLDQNNLNMTMNLRNNFGRLAESLLAEGKRDSAMNALDKCLKEMPDSTVPYNVMMIRIAEMYYAIANYGATNARPAMVDTLPNGQIMQTPAIAAQPPLPFKRSQEAIANGDAIMRRLGEIYENDVAYYESLLGSRHFSSVSDEAGQCLAVFRELDRICTRYERTKIADEMKARFTKWGPKFPLPNM